MKTECTNLVAQRDCIERELPEPMLCLACKRWVDETREEETKRRMDVAFNLKYGGLY